MSLTIRDAVSTHCLVPSSNRMIRHKIRLVASIIGAGMGLSFLYYGYVHFFTHKIYPFNTFLFITEDRFSDYWEPLKFCSTLDPYRNHASNYLPLANVLFYILSKTYKI